MANAIDLQKVMPFMMAENISHQTAAMRGYYRWHAAIYDATRWSFLFGRKEILKQLPVEKPAERTLLEVGCGTGHNLRFLAEKFPYLQLLGVDVSPEMLAQTKKVVAKYPERVKLFEQAYGASALNFTQQPDFVLFSYALTMFNPGWETAIERAWQDLPKGGRIAVVDFHDTRSGAFRWWMGRNHVRMEEHLLPFLQSKFRTELLEIRPTWLGLWQYFMFIGQKI